MGKWIDKAEPKPPEHVHRFPGEAELYNPGAIWECDCGANFIVWWEREKRKLFLTWHKMFDKPGDLINDPRLVDYGS